MAYYPAGYRAGVDVIGGPATSELPATLAQAKVIAASCTTKALNASNGGKGLTADQKTQLKTTLENMKTQVAAAADAITLRRSKIKTQLQRLQKQQAAIKTDNLVFADYYRLMSPAIAVCPEAADTAAASHTAIQPVVRQSVELNYKILLATAQDGILGQRLSLVQAALNSLDRAKYAIS